MTNIFLECKCSLGKHTNTKVTKITVSFYERYHDLFGASRLEKWDIIWFLLRREC